VKPNRAAIIAMMKNNIAHPSITIHLLQGTGLSG